MLNIASIVPLTEAEGPGKRFAVWVQGCPFRCPECCNPHYLAFESKSSTRMEPASLARKIIEQKELIEGVTFIGGEPFAQAAGLAKVARLIRAEGLSVMVFSGYTMKELNDGSTVDYAERQQLIAQTDLLVDGQYKRELHVNDRRWIGSANQEVHFLTERYKHLKDHWPAESNTIEIRLKNGELTINGFPHQEVTKATLDSLKRKKR